jgi:hypothetical protein
MWYSFLFFSAFFVTWNFIIMLFQFEQVVEFSRLICTLVIVWQVVEDSIYVVLLSTDGVYLFFILVYLKVEKKFVSISLEAK